MRVRNHNNASDCGVAELFSPQILRLICPLFLLPLLAACPDNRPGQEADGPPNILLILVDDLGYNDLGYNGATEINTPNIDRLAKEGVAFSNGYVASPSCSPSRAGIMTGRYPARFGLEGNLTYAPFDNYHGLPVAEKTFASILQETGYRTGMVGKWHLGAGPPFHPLNRGFDSFQGFLGGGHHYFSVDANTSPLNEYLVPISENGNSTGLPGYLTDVLTDYAIEFVKEDGEQPFFLYLSYNAPHGPLQAPDKLVRKYAHVQDPDRRTYLAMVDSLDQNVGRLITALEKTGERDNTLIFFLSDNGGVKWLDQDLDYADNSPLRAGKGSLHEGGIQVPFAASWPAGWPRGRTFEPMVISLDIAATAIALAGAAPDPDLPLDGVNLDPFIRETAQGAPHEALFWRMAASHWLRSYAVRAGDVKLVNTGPSGETALFDLRTDPGETHNLAREDPDTAARLARTWNDWNRRNSANFVIAKPNYWLTIEETTRRMHEDALQWGSARLPFQIKSTPAPTTPAPTPRAAMGSGPAPPANLSAEGRDRSIVLRWSPVNAGDIIGYQFRLRSSDDSDWRPWRDMPASGPSTVSHLLRGLSYERLYQAQVRALNHAGEGEPSEASAFTATPGSGPAHSARQRRR